MNKYVTPNKYVNLINEKYGNGTITRAAIYYRIDNGLMDVRTEKTLSGKVNKFIDLEKYPIEEFKKELPGRKK
jgi:hypothetical protein